MSPRLHAALVILLCFVCTACAVQDGTGRYRVASIGNAQRSIEAIILSAEPVMIQASTSGAGATSGGLLAGAVAAENSDNAAVIIAGIIGGAIIGNALESAANTHEGMEYVIETDAGLLLTVAQINKGSDIFSTGGRVILVYGYPNRLIKDPRKH